jgi:hypothetical protein
MPRIVIIRQNSRAPNITRSPNPKPKVKIPFKIPTDTMMQKRKYSIEIKIIYVVFVKSILNIR